MPHSLAVLDSVRSSNLPHSEKTAIRRFYEKLAPRAHSSVGSAMSSVQSTVTSLGQKVGLSHHVAVKGTHALRAGGEALILGGALGALDAKLGTPGKSGLDVNVPVGAGYSVPIDGVLGVVGMVASAVPALDIISDDARTAGIIGIASWSQRQAKEWVNKTPTSPSVQGEYGEDPVLAWASKQG